MGTDIVGAWLIPAHAGKTHAKRSGSKPRKAHPRSRGENPALVTMDEIWKGSSPLTRGKLSFLHGHATAPRLIPAHAGKTSPGRRSHPYCRAHPRSRGENQQAAIEEQKAKGSSPLTRGKR